jgi:hypothetical protein
MVLRRPSQPSISGPRHIFLLFDAPPLLHLRPLLFVFRTEKVSRRPLKELVCPVFWISISSLASANPPNLFVLEFRSPPGSNSGSPCFVASYFSYFLSSLPYELDYSIYEHSARDASYPSLASSLPDPAGSPLPNLLLSLGFRGLCWQGYFKVLQPLIRKSLVPSRLQTSCARLQRPTTRPSCLDAPKTSRS